MTDDIKTLQDAAKHLLPIYEHLANGGSMNDVQESSFIQGQEWHPAGGGVIVNITGVLGNGFRYRIKPKLCELWAVLDCDGDVRFTSDSEEGAEERRDSLNEHGDFAPYRVAHMREVTK